MEFDAASLALRVWLLGAIILGGLTGKMGICFAVGIPLALCFGGVAWVRGAGGSQRRVPNRPGIISTEIERIPFPGGFWERTGWVK